MPARRSLSVDWERSLDRLERQLPAPVRRLLRQLVRNLQQAQRQLERARAERDVRWQKLQTQIRRDAARLLRQLERAVEPPAPRKARRARPRTRGRAPRPGTSSPETSA
jgi:DNA-binding protein H-NS